uniref:Putative ml domain salivary peptide n=1 Tax=Corethrella appendiculata TaxID=1370023 RepID=U5EPT8_9DIPT
MHFINLIFYSICLFLVVDATKVNPCPGKSSKQLTNDVVEINNCNKGVCKLRRKTRAEIKHIFTLDNDVDELVTNVFARVLELPLPFVGVDGKSACKSMFEEDCTTKVSCPLKGGKRYCYKNSFPIEEFYPKLSMDVHYELKSKRDGKSEACFEVPAKIV